MMIVIVKYGNEMFSIFILPELYCLARTKVRLMLNISHIFPGPGHQHHQCSAGEQSHACRGGFGSGAGDPEDHWALLPAARHQGWGPPHEWPRGGADDGKPPCLFLSHSHSSFQKLRKSIFSEKILVNLLTYKKKRPGRVRLGTSEDFRLHFGKRKDLLSGMGAKLAVLAVTSEEALDCPLCFCRLQRKV